MFHPQNFVRTKEKKNKTKKQNELNKVNIWLRDWLIEETKPNEKKEY